MFFQKQEELDILPPPPPFPDISGVSENGKQINDTIPKKEHPLKEDFSKIEHDIIKAAKKLEKSFEKSFLHHNKKEKSEIQKPRKKIFEEDSYKSPLPKFLDEGDYIELQRDKLPHESIKEDKKIIKTQKEPDFKSKDQLLEQEFLDQGDYIELEKDKLPHDLAKYQEADEKGIFSTKDFSEKDDNRGLDFSSLEMEVPPPPEKLKKNKSFFKNLFSKKKVTDIPPPPDNSEAEFPKKDIEDTSFEPDAKHPLPASQPFGLKLPEMDKEEKGQDVFFDKEEIVPKQDVQDNQSLDTLFADEDSLIPAAHHDASKPSDENSIIKEEPLQKQFAELKPSLEIPSDKITKPEEVYNAEYEIKKAISDLRTKKEAEEKTKPNKSLLGFLKPKQKKQTTDLPKEKHISDSLPEPKSLNEYPPNYNEKLSSADLPMPQIDEQPEEKIAVDEIVDYVTFIQDKIHEARNALMNFDLNKAKEIYIDIMRAYNSMEPQQQMQVYNMVHDLYQERKAAEKMYNRHS